MDLPVTTPTDHVHGMTSLPWHPSRGEDLNPSPDERKFDFPCDDLLASERDRLATLSADCCVATPAYRVVLPVHGARTRPAVLLLCGHHLHMSRLALRSAGAAVYDDQDRLVSGGAAALS
jgi:hypothetical protein